MTAAEIIDELKRLGNAQYKATMLRHGCQEPIYGVKIEELKKYQKRIKQDYQLALDLYETGVSDAMYLAGMIADDEAMTKKDLQRWVTQANSPLICGSTVASVAAGNPHGSELALEWIDSKQSSIACTGWNTLGLIVAITPDEELDLPEIKRLLNRVKQTIHQQPDRVPYCMNSFVIAVGGYISSLFDLAMQTAKEIGRVEVDMGDTDCKVPSAPDYLTKIKTMGRIGKKRKSAKC